VKKYLFSLLVLFFYGSPAFSDIHYRNASQDKTAQELFDKGMLNFYAYLYVQAKYDFEQALLHDSECGMCYWGLAVAKKHEMLELGQPFATVGLADIQKAGSLVFPQNKFQYDLVQATLNSFSSDPEMSSRQLQFNYIGALRKLNQKYKNDAEWREESLALFVDALAYYANVDEGDMKNHCGNLLNKVSRQEAIDLLVPVLKNPSYPDHPGLLHTYIHMAELDINDPLGEIAAQKITQFSGGEIAHYAHMPNHIYWRREWYDKAIQANLDAISIDKNYFKHGGVGLNSYYYEYHYLHSYHFLSLLGVLINNFDLSIQNARDIKNLMDVNRMENLKDYRDVFLSLEHLVLARFKKWQQVLKLETPQKTNKLGILFIDFSKSLAYLNLGQRVQFKKYYEKIKKEKYQQENLREFQILILSYLEASAMNLQRASLAKLENVFLKNNVAKIEKKLFVMNPPTWFFPYQLFLSDAAAERGNLSSAKKHHDLYEKIYPKSTLGDSPSGLCQSGSKSVNRINPPYTDRPYFQVG